MDLRAGLEFLMEVNALDDVVRAGWVMCGVRDPESVGSHSLGVAAAALVLADRHGEPVDRGRLLTMAILHDLGEARTGDVPMVAKTADDTRREDTAADEILAGLPPRYGAILREYREGVTLEARLVRAADKVQLMAKVAAYESQGRGRLEGFWENPGNFREEELPAARELHRMIREMRGRGR